MSGSLPRLTAAAGLRGAAPAGVGALTVLLCVFELDGRNGALTVLLCVFELDGRNRFSVVAAQRVGHDDQG